MVDAGNLSDAVEKSGSRSPLERVLDAEHEHIRELAAQASRAQPSGDEPRLHYRVTDTFSAVLSRHLAAVDDVLLPQAGKKLSHGHAAVHDYVRHARGLEHTLRLLKARLYGEATASHWTWEEVWHSLDEWFDDHVSHEQQLIHALAEHLSSQEAFRLAARLRNAEEHSPTRPHPYSPHTGPLGRLAHRFWSFADNFWDDAEGRVVPHRSRGPHPRRDSLLSRYFLGTPKHQPQRSETEPETGGQDR